MTGNQITKALALAAPPTWHPSLRAAMSEFEINTPRRVAGFLAQTAHESAGFTRLEESLNYSAVRLAQVWPNRFASRGLPNLLALKLGGIKGLQAADQQAIANSVYADRMGNGSPESGDGWRYRGRGPLQITGRANYAECTIALDVDLLEHPGLLTQPEHGARSAAWFWHSRGCSALMDANDFAGCTRRINGGFIGLADRRDRYTALLAVLQA